MITDTDLAIKPFLGKDFLLDNQVSSKLYHDYAASMPIIDYHCHLSPKDIAEDRNFHNLTQIWLAGDHYKWRAMRASGVNEKFITGNAPDEEKFKHWAATVPYTIRNPLFHWTHLELKRYFDVEELLTPDSADSIYHQCTELLQTPAYSTRNLLKMMEVRVVCTTDDPTDDLRYHRKIREENIDIKMLPAFRPDRLLAIDQTNAFLNYVKRLSNAANLEIRDYNSLLDALDNRMDYFESLGCCLSDHGLEQVYAEDFTDNKLNNVLKKVLAGRLPDFDEVLLFRSGLLFHLGLRYAERNWVQQFHLGALRNNSSRMVRQLGPDTGFDSIGDWPQASELAIFLDSLDCRNKLAKTILYNLNPADNEVMASMIGNFNDGTVRGKMQFGSAWWFLDQKDGMEKQLNALSNLGILSHFVGMLTDSRSFLSYPRHEYFRRILCNLIGRDVVNGELPNDLKWLGGIIQDICYHNANQYFFNNKII